MYNKNIKNSHINLRSEDNYTYLVRNNIILDKTCPGCNQIIIEDKDFCNCGFYLKAAKSSQFWSYAFGVLIIVGISLLIGIIGFDKIKTHTFNEMHKKNMNFNSLLPVNIKVIASLKSTPYDGFIQGIYVKHEEDNRLMVLIRPALWNTLTAKEKQDLLKELTDSWIMIYQQSHPGSNKKPEVLFVNAE